MREYAYAMFRHWWIDTLCLAMIDQLILIINTCILLLHPAASVVNLDWQNLRKKWLRSDRSFRSGLHLHAQMVSPCGWNDCACSHWEERGLGSSKFHFSVQYVVSNSLATLWIICVRAIWTDGQIFEWRVQHALEGGRGEQKWESSVGSQTNGDHVFPLGSGTPIHKCNDH